MIPAFLEKISKLKTQVGIALILSAHVKAIEMNAVYFAQTHVQEASNPYFNLVSDREALLKVDLSDSEKRLSPRVYAYLEFKDLGKTKILELKGPKRLPESFPSDLGKIVHKHSNSFTTTIPKEWVKPGLTVSIKAGDILKEITDLDISAPNRLLMTMFDVHYFKKTESDYPEGTISEMEAKWPVSKMIVNRARDIVFKELIIPPRPSENLPAVRCKSKEDYKEITGFKFDGEQAAALRWVHALSRASGRKRKTSIYYLNIHGVHAGGQGGSFCGVGNGKNPGLLIHEAAHALSLPHWRESKRFYPYKGDMHGIPAPKQITHVGPTWAYDLRLKKFITPVIQKGNSRGLPAGTYKYDPVQGGGLGCQESGFLMTHFSDYSVFVMRNYLQDRIAFWNEDLDAFAKWNKEESEYNVKIENNGVDYPIQRNVEVFSVMASLSGSNPDLCMIYPPIGPYMAGIIELYDPRLEEDRAKAKANYSLKNGCDFSLRVKQGDKEQIYMLAASYEEGVDLTRSRSLLTEAINLPVSHGKVTRVELLHTPDAEINGMPETPKVLAFWPR